ncbi:MAG: DUF2191 domain-containing protein [Gammaproteobacteria bacterium]|nr:DUF2191 domain-containing protein [Gammaproteobacteria bacterium]
MRTTLNIDDQILTMAKHRAIEEGIPLTRVVENALRDAFLSTEEKKSEIHLLTVNGAGVRPGIDLDNTSSLLDIMEELE